MRTIRFVVRCGVLAMLVVCSLPLLPWSWAPQVPPAVSPFLTIGSAIAGRVLTTAFLIGIPFGLMAMVSRRWLCRNICPIGLLLEPLARLGPSKTAGFPPLGQWIALLTFGGACLGYPLLLWSDPMALFSGFFGAFTKSLTVTALLSAIGLPLVLLISLVRPNLWCAKLCPLGATQDFLALPRRLLRRSQSETPDAGDVPLAPYRFGTGLARRSVLAMGLGAAWAAVTLRFPRAEAARPLRPPGAIAERRFTGVCVRCGSCVRACPTKIIQPDLGQGGVAGFLAPALDFDKGYCLETCSRCTEVCPSGAISRLSLEQKRRTPIGLAQVDMEHCLLGEDKECSICVARCPYQAITIAFDRESYTSIPRIARDKCPGCGACELACPTTPKAITVRP